MTRTRLSHAASLETLVTDIKLCCCSCSWLLPAGSSRWFAGQVIQNPRDARYRPNLAYHFGDQLYGEVLARNGGDSCHEVHCFKRSDYNGAAAGGNTLQLGSVEMDWEQDHRHLAHTVRLTCIAQHLMSQVICLSHSGQYQGCEVGGGHLHNWMFHRSTEYIADPVDIMTHSRYKPSEIREVVPLRITH